MDYDKELDMFEMVFYTNMEWSCWWGGDLLWLGRIWKRIKAASKMLFTGWIEMERGFIFRGRDQILELSDELRKFVEENETE